MLMTYDYITLSQTASLIEGQEMTVICLKLSYILSFNRLKSPALMPEIFSYYREPPELRPPIPDVARESPSIAEL